MQTKIIPAILVHSLAELKEKIRLTENDFPVLQIDAIDGQFVDHATYYDIEELQKIKTVSSFELHLMVNDPLSVIKKVSSPKISRIIFHLEPVGHSAGEIIAEIKRRGAKAGLALNPETPLTELKPYLDKIEIVLLMTVQPGWSGQGFIEASYEKIRQLRQLAEDIEIEVDGGVKDFNLKQIIAAGVNSPAVGSALLQAADYASTVKKLKAAIKSC
ncbi:MAG TPA: hypothetical protein DEB69_00555 [Candidatus Komeilibacteria bacterium]|nr:MAG: Ribulose-phosphate 3-epimerase [Parcubacteria group bacterium GW2011_GWF2_45_11]OGY93497.1 MAG: hypothetical protein A3J95_02840 [Candidatus Komeilibacteria bacterium RIFOXYC2_FULL_45_12]OGY94857.1 MAG: hypothetical protein A2260_02080 [Candidatus Komeilibacteria bacterium RIFOXYA2_FULL_45_9]HBR13488.1 hypothetical protein [Candidatus Komeilibacteria bacterium]HBV01897.1 hypothetical protein [Candidatus Komeilibacteria bacterium]